MIALIGQLGAGKTQFVRGMGIAMGISHHDIASPTYVLMHEYEPEGERLDANAPILVHIDAYRLAGPQDLQTIGWDVDSNGSEIREDAVVAIEWADRVEAVISDQTLCIRLSHESDEQRNIVIDISENWAKRFAKIDEAIKPFELPAVTTPCPICQSPADEASESYPFCTKRCRQVDLGKWLKGDYLISRPIEQADLDEE